MKKSKEINLFDVEKQLLGNRRESEENKAEEMQCSLANGKSMQSYFWSARKAKIWTQDKSLKPSFPGVEKKSQEMKHGMFTG